MGIRRILRDNTRYVILMAAIVVFIAVLEDVRSDDILRLDHYAYKLFVVKLRRPWITTIMEAISNLSSPVTIMVMFLMVVAFAPGRRPGLCVAVNLVSVFAINQVLKYIVHRPRPEGFNLISETGYSFPSGHSMISMAFYGLCAWMVWNYERDRILRWLCCLSFAFIICMVGASRIYLGVHYASDVLAGFCVSLGWICFYTKVVCPLFMPEVTVQHQAETESPAYVEPEHLYVADDTTTMEARHMKWKLEATSEDTGTDEERPET